MRSTRPHRSARLANLALAFALAGGAGAGAQEKADGPGTPPAAVAAPAGAGDAATREAAAPPKPLIPINPAVVPEAKPGAWLRQHEHSWSAGETGRGRPPLPRRLDHRGLERRPRHLDALLRPAAGGQLRDRRRPDPARPLAARQRRGRRDPPPGRRPHDRDQQPRPNPEAEVAEGVKAILDRLRAKLPETKVLLLGVFPRGSNRDKTVPTVAPDPRIARVNARLAAFDDGETVKYLDIGVHFLDDAGQVSRTNMPDFLHLSPGAYQLWADAIEPNLWEMLDEDE